MSWIVTSAGIKHNRLPYFVNADRLLDQRFGQVHEVLKAVDLLDKAIVAIDDLPLLSDMRDSLQQAIDAVTQSLSDLVDDVQQQQQANNQALQDAINNLQSAIATAINDLQSQIANSLLSVSSKAGNTMFHDNAIVGAKSINEMRQAGWAVEDGTTYESQLVATGYFVLSDLAFVGATRNLIDPLSGRGGLFVRSGATAGLLQEDALQDHAHTYNHLTGDVGWNQYMSSSIYSPGVENMSTGRSASETRPANISRIPLIYALK